MALTWFTCTGEQQQLFVGGFHSVLSIEAQLTVKGSQVRQLSSTTAKRYLRIGWLALGFDAGVPFIGIGWADYLSWDYQYWLDYPGVRGAYDRLITHIEPGSTIKVGITW